MAVRVRQSSHETGMNPTKRALKANQKNDCLSQNIPTLNPSATPFLPDLEKSSSKPSAEWNTPKSDLLRRLEWSALWWRRAVLSACLLYDILKTGKHPIKECIYPLVSEKSQYSFWKPMNLLLPVARTTRTQKSFFFNSSLLWNALPSTIQQLPTKQSFKKAIEFHGAHSINPDFVDFTGFWMS